MTADLTEVGRLVGQLFRDAPAPAVDGAGDLAVPLFVVEGIDGAGKTTFTDCLIGGGASAVPPPLALKVLRLGQRAEIPAGLREIYGRQILSIVEAGRRFAEIPDFLLEAAALDVLLYRIRLRSAKLALGPHDRFISDSWSYRRFCKFALLAHRLACDGDLRRSSGIIEQLYAAYRPTFVASGGVVLAVSRRDAAARKAGRFSPWETIALGRDASNDETARFLDMIEGTSALLSATGEARGWPVIARPEPLPPIAADAPEFTRFQALVRAWAS